MQEEMEQKAYDRGCRRRRRDGAGQRQARGRLPGPSTPEAVDPEDVEMLQDLVIAAVNEALRKADSEACRRDGQADRRPRIWAVCSTMRYFPPAFEAADRTVCPPARHRQKTAQRLAFHVLSVARRRGGGICTAPILAGEAQRSTTCPVCQNLTDQPVCSICSDDAAGPRAHLRGGRAQGCHRHGAGPGVSRGVPCAARRHLAAATTSGTRTISASRSCWTGSRKAAASGRSSWRPTPTPRARPRRCIFARLLRRCGRQGHAPGLRHPSRQPAGSMPMRSPSCARWKGAAKFKL